ncbi:hypothetical protein [Kitasatospora sp. NPDC088351]|uniref:hypothetical protein n=1 Tax=Kitasatospora sp. NPDC088351 TaxID=3155180 RepID=UPI003437B457
MTVKDSQPAISVSPVFTGPAARCQYKSLPLRDLPPLGLVRQARMAREEARERHAGAPAPGRPSAFAVGDWVRVKDADAVRATLDEQDRHRGLWFTDSQWSYCGRTYRVEHIVRRMVDDHYRMRRLSSTTTLAGATCLGADRTQGCGLACALLFRDEWLEPSTAEAAHVIPSDYRATVRSLPEIQATLDGSGRLHGVPFHPGMARFAGTRHGATHVGHRALAWWQRPVGGDWYVLDSLRCGGEPLPETGCDRQCGLLWHASWLRLEPATGE